LAAPFGVIIVYEAQKFGMEIENFAFYMPIISIGYTILSLQSTPFDGRIQQITC